ncbi:MAG: C40 family peptidase [Chloroherpetonaceae bacterium]|nr:C40 family peptidase [Chthonomonadaceae bacterium]MDW8207976.1 C40 family peptidase [Chloroherpetonaceae bacterium]
MRPITTQRILALAGMLVAHAPRLLADDTLVLELPPSREALELREAERTRAAQAVARTPILPRGSRPPARRGRLPSRGRQNDAEPVVGRLGLLEKRTPIYRGRSYQAQELIVAPAGTYVAVQGQQNGWVGVLMADGSTGWVPPGAVRLLDYQVVSTGQVPMPSGRREPNDIFPATDQPFFTGNAQALLNEAYRYLGVRYVWGGNTFNGIDCSGFIKNVFAKLGYVLPRTSSEQITVGMPVPREELQAGDRLYFGRRKDILGVTHTGLYIGDGYFIHSSSSRGGVAISHLSEPTWARIYQCARR